MIVVAVLVCLFAVGMAALLNYFKYRSTADRIVNGRLVVIGKGIENSIQASLALGLTFSDLGTLPSLMEREQTADDLILEIKVFDTDGKPLYSTNRLKMARTVPASWLAAARRAGDADWFVQENGDNTVGIPIKNNFGLTVGYLALRYSRDNIDRAAHVVAKNLVLTALGVFAGAAALASLALTLVMRRLERDMSMVEAALQHSGSAGPAEEINEGPFGPALARFFDMVRAAEVQIAAIRGRLARGTRS
jgi:hypothetical protein